MKILFLTTQFPYPLDNGGKIGAYNGISVVSRDNDVTVLSFTEQLEYVDEGLRYLKNHLPEVVFERPITHSVHIRKKILTLAGVMLKGYLKKLPYVTVKFENKGMYRLIDKMFKERHWDIIFIDYLNMQIYGEYIVHKYQNCYKYMMLKDHNLEYEIVKQASEKAHGIKRVILTAEWKRTCEYEKKAISNADFVYSVCEENTNFMKQYNPLSYTMLPTYESNSSYHISKNNRILYMGNLSWDANMEGLVWFVENVLPLINEKIPDVKLTIVGSGSVENPFMNNLNVDYRGYLKDISKVYDDHAVFIVPLFEGSGIRIKILEAFDNGIAVVSTLLGCRTIGATDGKEILIRDDADGFAKAVISLLLNPSERKRLENNAKVFLEKKFSLKARQDEFRANIERLQMEKIYYE